MTDDDDLVKRLRDRAKHERLIQANNEAVAAALMGQRLLFDQGHRSPSNTYAVRLYLDHEKCARQDAELAADWDETADRIEALEAKLAKAVEALEGCMIGGNHLVTWLPENHLPADTDPLAALVRHGAGVSHDIWCCWRSIMQARSTLAELTGAKP